MNLSAARIFVRDLSQARHFYAETLGFPLKVDGSGFGYCVFEAGKVVLVVEVVDQDAPEEDQILVGRFTGLSFSVEDVHTKHSELKAKGVEFSGPPEEQVWGGTLATFRDPAGNELQIVQYAAV